MNFWDLFTLIRRLPIDELLDFPNDIEGSEAVRSWCAAVLDAADVFADLTGTEIDDKVVLALDSILDDDEAWAAIHGLLVKLVGKKMSIASEATEISKKIGLDPAIIMLIIQVLRMLLELYQRRNK